MNKTIKQAERYEAPAMGVFAVTTLRNQCLVSSTNSFGLEDEENYDE